MADPNAILHPNDTVAHLAALRQDADLESHLESIRGEPIEGTVAWPGTMRDVLDATLGVERECEGCGCTDSDACPGGCAWLTPEQLQARGFDPDMTVCTACAQEMDDLSRFVGGER